MARVGPATQRYGNRSPAMSPAGHLISLRPAGLTARRPFISKAIHIGRRRDRLSGKRCLSFCLAHNVRGSRHESAVVQLSMLVGIVMENLVRPTNQFNFKRTAI